MFNRNVGGRDRQLRAIGAGVAFVAAVMLTLEGSTAAALVAGMVGAGLGVNAATGFCLGNKLLGVNTCD